MDRGCGSYGLSKQHKWLIEEEEAGVHIKAAYDFGINTFDTADVYSNGESETILGRAIKKYNLPRDELVIMTKAWAPVGKAAESLWGTPDAELGKRRYANRYGLSRKHLFAAIKGSLERLQLDYVDVFWCHRFDYNTPIEETMHALNDIVKAGYARYIGMSSCYAWQFHKMQNYARQNGLVEFIAMQNLYNALYREEEREMVPLLKDLGVGMMPWSPLAGGALARPIDASTRRKESDPIGRMLSDVPFLGKLNATIERIAKEKGVSMAQVALAWSLSKEVVTAPIIGATSVEKLKELTDAVHIKLTKEQTDAINAIYQPRPIAGFS
ncbi:hypothetical protein FRB99_002169 [Tulasnella sp. 403]|nr:hypothetical protein FRB99_002169 [Tulasnella sp. 403]